MCSNVRDFVAAAAVVHCESVCAYVCVWKYKIVL